VDAARILGLDRSDVLFLDFPDGRLEYATDVARRIVRKLLARSNPAQIFVPHPNGGPRDNSDHKTTNAIVAAAGIGSLQHPDVYEYSAYSRACWPWVRRQAPEIAAADAVVGGLRRTLESIVELSHVVHVSSAVATKRAALDAYASQMTAPFPHPAWRTLREVGDGDFLQASTGPWEFFRKRAGSRGANIGCRPSPSEVEKTRSLSPADRLQRRSALWTREGRLGNEDIVKLYWRGGMLPLGGDARGFAARLTRAREFVAHDACTWFEGDAYDWESVRDLLQELITEGVIGYSAQH
jgi:LmbE family N-acetylglucosaminyl deacetylase